MPSIYMRTSTMTYMYFIIGLLFSFLSSLYVINYFLAGDDEYGESNTFPIDFITILSTLFFLLFYVLTYYKFVVDIRTFFMVSFFLSMLFITSYIDIRSQYIYDAVLIVYGLILFVLMYFTDGFSLKETLISILTGVGIYALIYIISKLIYKREAFGQGDVLLMGVGSMLLSPMSALLASFLSFYIAAIFILIFYLFGKKTETMSELPFGQYICLSLAIMFNFSEEIQGFIHSLL